MATIKFKGGGSREVSNTTGLIFKDSVEKKEDVRIAMHDTVSGFFVIKTEDIESVTGIEEKG